MLKIINLTALLGIGVLVGTNMTTDDARSSVQKVRATAPIGCQTSAKTSDVAGVCNIRVSESVQAKADKKSHCSPAATQTASVQAASVPSPQSAVTLASFIEKLQYSIKGAPAGDKETKCAIVNCDPTNCDPSQCDTSNCDPSQCDPSDCKPASCKPIECVSACKSKSASSDNQSGTAMAGQRLE